MPADGVWDGDVPAPYATGGLTRERTRRMTISRELRRCGTVRREDFCKTRERRAGIAQFARYSKKFARRLRPYAARTGPHGERIPPGGLPVLAWTRARRSFGRRR